MHSLRAQLFLTAFLLCLVASPALAECPYCYREGSLSAYSDGRMFCVTCLKNNVFTEEVATPLRWEVETFLTTHFGNNRYAVSFTLYDEPEFEVFRKRSRLGKSIQGIYMNRERTVTVKSGLAPLNFQGLLVHESTHAWQHQFCPKQDLALSEGFASLMQYRFIASHKGPKWLLQSLENDPDPNYGASLKKLLKKEKELGLFPLIDKVQKSKTLAEALAN